MEDEQEFLMRPVGKGMCKYESLKDGTLDLVDLLLMNHYLDVEIYNHNLMIQNR